MADSEALLSRSAVLEGKRGSELIRLGLEQGVQREKKELEALQSLEEEVKAAVRDGDRKVVEEKLRRLSICEAEANEDLDEKI